MSGLNGYARSIFSQNGEDGIVKHIFSEIGFASKQFLEFGFGLPQCIAWRLMVKEGFGGVFIDKQTEICRDFRNKYGLKPVHAIPTLLTIENIEDVVSSSRLPEEIDLLSIDVDGNDYWLWKALECVSPRLVVVEYNAVLGPYLLKTIAYDPAFSWGVGYKKPYHGASLAALHKLGDSKGYRLIGCGPAGVNAFFLRKDVQGSACETLSPEVAYRSSPNLDAEREWSGVKDLPWEDV